MKTILVALLLLSCLEPGAFAGPARQKICPVTGEALGGDTGEIIPYQDGGRTILFCCKSCVKKYKANPQKYAAATKKALAGG
jgi:hypothetical protein